MKNSQFINCIQKATIPLPGSTPKSVTYKLTVKKKYEGLTVVDFFSQAVPRSTPQLWIDKVTSQNLTINGKVIAPNYLVKAGDIAIHTSEPKIEPEVNTNISLLYADEDIWIINKPSPLPVHASGRFKRNTLLEILELAFPNDEFKLLHRIDANTTGIVLIAKNKASANTIREQFEAKSIQKTYAALVEGIIQENNITSIQSIGNKVLVGGARAVDEQGKKSETDIEVVERRTEKNQTLLKVTPLTGRTNQIRLHLAHLGYPIVGDLGHQDKTYFVNQPFTYPTDSLFLHAYQISFQHPKTGKTLSFEAPLPEKFSE
jgi:23S rRNA pseudouridine1911/1915/1917 synthase